MIKSRIFIALLIAGFFLYACERPATVVKEIPLETIERPAPTGEELLARANALFQEGSHQEALETCNDYLLRFPDGALAPEILMRAGAAYTALDLHESARAAYQKLIMTFPDSPLVPEARISTLAAFYKEGAYESVVQGAADLGGYPFQGDQLARIYMLLGNSRLAMGAPTEAVLSYTMAHASSMEADKTSIVNHLKTAVRQLSREELITLLQSLDDDAVRALLLHQLGLRYFEAGEYEEARNTLAEFLQFFPDHEYAPRSKNMLDVIEEALKFKGVAIGCLFPLTGGSKIFGERALNGVELALNRLAGREGADSFRIVVKDTASDPERAENAVKELVEDRVSAIIGPFHFTAEAAADMAQVLETPIITITQKDRITGRGGYVFRHFITPEMQVRALVSHAAGTLGMRRFAILYPDGKYGRKFMNLFWDEALLQGGRIVGLEKYDTRRTDFADPIKKLVGRYHEIPPDLMDLVHPPLEEPPDEISEDDAPASEEGAASPGRRSSDDDDEPPAIVDFDAVFLPDKPSRAGLIIPQLAYYDVDGVQLLGTNLWHSQKIIEMAGPYVQGAVMPDIFFAESDSPAVAEFVALHEETYGKKPGFVEAVTYDTATLLLNILGQPDANDRSAVRDRLMTVNDFQGVTGSIAMDEEGSADKKLYLLNIEGRSFVEVKPPEKPAPDGPGEAPREEAPEPGEEAPAPGEEAPRD
ncbi:MAG: ABC transporter substrate-binding protein [Desulfobacterales bacterium]|nr:ABC transporter substrate-binding protein [Desulfobacterales bacterium]